MSDEITDKLRRLHQYTSDLTALMASVQAQTPPEEATGTEGQRAWSEGFDSASWLAEAERVETRGEQQNEGAPVSPTPEAPVCGQPRDVLAMTEDVLKALRNARGRAVEQPVPAAGRNRERSIFITLSPAGLQGCEIEPRWAAGESDGGINSGLSEALARAAGARMINNLM
ncbi:hypothetical protein [Micromonospora sp. NPDC001898]|uniref:hypothetical protein n=1 Tax=Micromonospora sp. NPDC001898 TaxID=3364221 RepID=UPI00368CD930